MKSTKFEAPFCQERIYAEHGHQVIEEKDIHPGYRFDVKRITLQKPDGSTYTNLVTHSAPSAEAICLRRREGSGEWEMVFVLQSRTPYKAEKNRGNGEKEIYAKFFLEQPAGLLQEGENYENAAIREIEEETGYEWVAMLPLMKPIICRHVSYSDETSRVFVAFLGSKKEQHLDPNENIYVQSYFLEEVETALEEYLEGKKATFLNFDVPEMTILSLLRFFQKWNRGDFEELVATCYD